MSLNTFTIRNWSGEGIFKKTWNMMSQRSMAITHCKEMLPSSIVDIRIDYEIILIDLSRVSRYVSFFCSVWKTHDILKKLRVIFCVCFSQILP